MTLGKIIWCWLFHKHVIYENSKLPTRKCRKCGMYYRKGSK